MLPKQQAFKVHAPDAPTLVEGVGTDLQTVHSVMLTNDMYVTWTTGEPGDSFPIHSHMPEMYQILTTIKGECVWYYKDNDGEEQSIEAGPGDVVYLPGGAENRVEVVGDAGEFDEQEPNILRGVIETEDGELVATSEFDHDLTERYPSKELEVHDVPGAFVFHVETDGSFSVEELVTRAVESIGDRAAELETKVAV